MSFELKDWVNFPPEEPELDKILLQLWRDAEKGDYHDSDLLSFIKTWEWLYSFEDETRWMDDSNFAGMKELRKSIIKKYIQTISFLWQDKETEEIELHINHTFEDIDRKINIQAEIDAWRNQELAILSKATKQIVFDLVDARSLLRNSEEIEFSTPEEIFFFVLNLLSLEKLAAYLNGNGKRMVIFPLKRWDFDGIILLSNYISSINHSSDVTMALYDMWMPTEKSQWSLLSLSYLCEEAWIEITDLDKIKLKQS